MAVLSELGQVPDVLRVQWQPRERVEARIRAGLTRMLRHAHAAVPAYAGSEYDVGEVRSLTEFAALPVLTKAAVRAEPERYHDPSLRPGEYLVMRTSGSTGASLELRHDVRNFAHDRAANVRRLLATECWRPWFRLYQFKAWQIPPRWHERIGLARRTIVDCNLPLEQTRAQVVRRPAQVLMGYPVLLRDLLRTLDDRELARVRRSLRMLLTDSELLTPEMRRQLREGFGVPVFDEYSAFETLHLSFECAAGSLHLAEDRVHVEVVDDDDRPVPDGDEGFVVVTGYRERAMPLVRYRLGDVAAVDPDPCPCGRTLRRLRLTRGRADDFVVLPGDGQRLYFGTFVGLMFTVDGVAECMVRQDREGNVTLHVVVDPRSGREFSEIAADCAAYLRGAVRRELPLRVCRAESVERTAAGKGRFVVSEYRPRDRAGG